MSKRSAPAWESHTSAAPGWLLNPPKKKKNKVKIRTLFFFFPGYYYQICGQKKHKKRNKLCNYLGCDDLNRWIALLERMLTRRGLGQTTQEETGTTNPLDSSGDDMKAFCWRLQWFIFFFLNHFLSTEERLTCLRIIQKQISVVLKDVI